MAEEGTVEVFHDNPVSYEKLVPSNGAVIRLDKVSKSLGGRQVLNELSLEVHKGETLAIVGGSGAGKSVTLKHIVGLLKPDAGNVFVDGVDISTARSKAVEEVRKKIGFVFQNGALLGSIDVYENVAMPLREHERLPEPEILKRVEKALALVGLPDALHKMPSELSGGMRKRASLARAVVRQPEIILYDEPTSGLDPVLSGMINELIIKARKELGVTSIVVTHDIPSVARVANRVVFLRGGAVHFYGTAEEFLKSTDPTIRQFIDGDPDGPLADEYQKGHR